MESALRNGLRPGLGTCAGCRFHYVTYDPRMPYGCQMFGFKSRRAPVLEVVAATRQACEGYQQRQIRER